MLKDELLSPPVKALDSELIGTNYKSVEADMFQVYKKDYLTAYLSQFESEYKMKLVVQILQPLRNTWENLDDVKEILSTNFDLLISEDALAQIGDIADQTTFKNYVMALQELVGNHNNATTMMKILSNQIAELKKLF